MGVSRKLHQGMRGPYGHRGMQNAKVSYFVHSMCKIVQFSYFVYFRRKIKITRVSYCVHYTRVLNLKISILDHNILFS